MYINLYMFMCVSERDFGKEKCCRCLGVVGVEKKDLDIESN